MIQTPIMANHNAPVPNRSPRAGSLSLHDEGESVIRFPDGLLGFPDVHRFRLVDMDRAAPFKMLKAIDYEDLAFIAVDPRHFRPSYSLVVPASELAGLELDSVDDAEVYALVVIPEDPSRMTANLRGPLVINRRKGLGKQVVLLSHEYSTSHMILEEMRSQL